MKAIAYDNPQIGCYVDASAQSADHCNRRTIEFAEGYGFEPGTYDGTDSEDLSMTADDAVEFLNGLETRSYLHWQFDDNSLFLLADIDGAREEVGFVSSKNQDYPAEDYEGEWLHVSDHGNATLYVRQSGKDTEIWGVV